MWRVMGSSKIWAFLGKMGVFVVICSALKTEEEREREEFWEVGFGRKLIEMGFKWGGFFSKIEILLGLVEKQLNCQNKI